MKAGRGPGLAGWIGFLVLLVFPVMAAQRIAVTWRWGAWFIPVVVVSSLVTFALYGLDKRCAERGAWRVPEATLHSGALFWGWPGAYLARYVFRHKTTKVSFRIVFWLIVVLHQAAAVDLVQGGRGFSAVRRLVPPDAAGGSAIR